MLYVGEGRGFAIKKELGSNPDYFLIKLSRMKLMVLPSSTYRSRNFTYFTL